VTLAGFINSKPKASAKNHVSGLIDSLFAQFIDFVEKSWRWFVNPVAGAHWRRF
jgi:hypothetical protein